MNPKIIIIIVVVLSLAGLLAFTMNNRAVQQSEASQKAAHESFMGSPPETSKPYNVLDYTKAPAHQ